MAQRGRLARAGKAAIDLPLGSWRRTLIAAVLLVGIVAAVVGVVTTRGDLRYASFPGHPYPPPGFYQNPFSNDPGDLIDAAEAAHVKSDFQRAGRIELEALEHGDTAVLTQVDTGNALIKLRELIDANNRNGIAEREEIQVDTMLVGRLADPNDPNVTWCVEERGSGTITYFVKATGQTQRSEKLVFSNRFWLVQVGQRYLITDVEVRSRQVQ